MLYVCLVNTKFLKIGLYERFSFKNFPGVVSKPPYWKGDLFLQDTLPALDEAQELRVLGPPRIMIFMNIGLYAA